MRTVAKLCEYIEVNPKELRAKGAVVKKVSMDKLQPFCRDIPEYEWAEFSGGSKFRNYTLSREWKNCNGRHFRF